MESCERPQPDDFSRLVTNAMTEYGLLDAKMVMLSFCSNVDDSLDYPGLPENVVIVKNVVRALNAILSACFEECPEKEATFGLLQLCRRLTRQLIERQLLVNEIPAAVLRDGLPAFPAAQGVGDMYLIVKFVKENLGRIVKLLEGVESAAELLEEVRRTDWARADHVEQFLDMFYDTFKEFGENQELTFQSMVPEWFALLHECQQGGEAGEEAKQEEVKQERPEDAAEPAEPADWVRVMRRIAERRLTAWMKQNLRREHYMATVLNPKLKQLQLLCTDIER